jgi:Ca2+-binding RTX toxin-like protein
MKKVTISLVNVVGPSNATFKSEIGLGQLPQAICIADFDNDGDQDLAYISCDYPTGEVLTAVRIWKNENGLLKPVNSAITKEKIFSFPGKLIATDFNQDGYKDLYVGTFGNETIAYLKLTATDEILLNAGNFNFNKDTSKTFPLSWAHGSKLGDLNNDGRTDIFSSGMLGWSSYYFLNKDDGWQIQDAGLTNLTGRQSIEDSLVGDFNNDGFQDLLLGANNDRTITKNVPLSSVKKYPAEIHWGTSDGIGPDIYKIPNPADIPYWNLTSFASVMGDLNRDGLPDLIISYTNDGNVLVGDEYYPGWYAANLGIDCPEVASTRELQILYNNGDNSFTDVTNLFTDSGNAISDAVAYALKLADFNQDGYLDIYAGLTRVSNKDGNFIWLNNAGKGFTPLDLSKSIGSSTLWDPVIMDLKSDGTPDIVFIESEYQNGGWYDRIKSISLSTSTSSNIYGSAHDDSIKLKNKSTYYADYGDDLVIGSKSNDLIYGQYGMDLIDGGLGNDTLTGGAGDDKFIFSYKIGKDNIDTITDFASGDKVALSSTIFTKLKGDKDLSDNFKSVASDNDDYLIYDSLTGKLYYDADGSGTKSQPIQIALVGTDTHAALTASDFVIV